MADQNIRTDREYIRETRTGGGSAYVFILGAVVAVLAVVAFFLWGDFDAGGPGAGGADSSGGGAVIIVIVIG